MDFMDKFLADPEVCYMFNDLEKLFQDEATLPQECYPEEILQEEATLLHTPQQCYPEYRPFGGPSGEVPAEAATAPTTTPHPHMINSYTTGFPTFPLDSPEVEMEARLNDEPYPISDCNRADRKEEDDNSRRNSILQSTFAPSMQIGTLNGGLTARQSENFANGISQGGREGYSNSCKTFAVHETAGIAEDSVRWNLFEELLGQWLCMIDCLDGQWVQLKVRMVREAIEGFGHGKSRILRFLSTVLERASQPWGLENSLQTSLRSRPENDHIRTLGQAMEALVRRIAVLDSVSELKKLFLEFGEKNGYFNETAESILNDLACHKRRLWVPKHSTLLPPTSLACPSAVPDRTYHNSNHGDRRLEFLFKKKLQNTDVRLGRVVIPKKYAETYLPPLTTEKQSIMIDMKDEATFYVWQLKYGFWSNHNSRMYILARTGAFVRTHGLEEGDYLVLYRDQHGNHVIGARKNTQPELRSSPNRTFTTSFEDGIINSDIRDATKMQMAYCGNFNENTNNDVKSSAKRRQPEVTDADIFITNETPATVTSNECVSDECDLSVLGSLPDLEDLEIYVDELLHSDLDDNLPPIADELIHELN